MVTPMSSTPSISRTLRSAAEPSRGSSERGSVALPRKSSCPSGSLSYTSTMRRASTEAPSNVNAWFIMNVFVGEARSAQGAVARPTRLDSSRAHARTAHAHTQTSPS
ncbi:hypothetical protein T492DRAFT_419073 [Pavlovales sp. CCMP2436]|nr:hypothetical protein T492DRAFT_419073 [Pavlovales sp. CCMP2436]